MAIDQKTVMNALKQAAIVVIGTPLVLMIPVVGPALSGLPTVWVVNLGQLVAGAAALVVGNMALDKLM